MYLPEKTNAMPKRTAENARTLAREYYTDQNIYDQDWQISELSQQGIASRAYSPGPYAELESMIAAWDRAYLRVLRRETTR